MKLIREDMLCELSGRCFAEALLEYLKKTDKIKKCKNYVTQFIEPYVDTKEKRKEYAKNPKIIEIKNDIKEFVKAWRSKVLALNGVKEIQIDPSPYFGLSMYIYVTFEPSSRQGIEFYKQHEDLYKAVKFRFTDHPEIDANKTNPTPKERTVDMVGKTFIVCANEMMHRIQDYQEDLYKQEKSGIGKAANSGSPEKSESYRKLHIRL